MIIYHLVKSFVWQLEVIKYWLVIVYLVIIDDSNGQGYEEEGVYYEEEPEENFNHLSNQGMLNTC